MSFIGYGFNAVWAYFEATKQMVSDGTLASPYNGVSHASHTCYCIACICKLN